MFKKLISSLGKIPIKKPFGSSSTLIVNTINIKHLKNALTLQNFSRTNRFNKVFLGVLFPGILVSIAKPFETECKSLEELESQLDKVISEQGEDSDEALKIYYELGFSYMHRGKSEQSLETLRRYLKFMMKRFGRESKEFSQALVQVSSVFTFFSNFPLAIDALKDALSIQKTIYGEHSKQVAQCYMNLGVVLSLIKEYEPAIEQLRKSYFLFREVEPESSHFIGLSLSTLARTLKIAGKREEALRAYEALNDMQLRLVGKNYPESQVVQSAISELKNQLNPSTLK